MQKTKKTKKTWGIGCAVDEVHELALLLALVYFSVVPQEPK